MFIETKDIFTVAGPTTSGRPYLNENQAGALSTSSTFLTDKKTLMNWIKRTPEAIGILRQIAADVITRINFTSVEKQMMGRPKADFGKDNEDTAFMFARQNNLKNTLRTAVMEEVALGDSYIWKGKADKEKAKELVKAKFKELGVDLSEFQAEQKALDEDFVGKAAIQIIPSSTVTIEVDETNTRIKSFVQRTTQNKTKKWLPPEVIHKKFMDIDGKVHGFTPFQSGFPIIKTLGAIKDYHGHYFESGVMPDAIFNFEELDSNSSEFHKMEQVIQEWYNNQRRSHVVTSSKFKLEKINEWNKDMEFRMLAIYYTGVIAFSIGMPLEKIRAILGGEIKSSAGGSDIGNTDYQRNIFDMQDDWENLLNSQFFNEEFKVNMKLERSAARDEHAEVMRDELKLNILEKLSNMDLIKKDKMTDMYEKAFPDIPRDWWNPNPKPKMEMGMMGTPGKPPFGPGKQALSDQKKNEQKPQQKNNPPTGMKEMFEIDMERFKEEVRAEKIGPDTKNQVEMEDRGKEVAFYLTPLGINKTYMTIVKKSELSNVDKYIFGSITKKSRRVDD